MTPESEETPLIAKAVLAAYIMLLTGVVSFLTIVLTKSLFERIGLFLMFAGCSGLMYYMGDLSPVFFIKENGRLKIRDLTKTEQVFAVISVVLFCCGLVIYEIFKT